LLFTTKYMGSFHPPVDQVRSEAYEKFEKQTIYPEFPTFFLIVHDVCDRFVQSNI